MWVGAGRYLIVIVALLYLYIGTRGLEIANIIQSGSSIVVNTDMVIGGSAINAIASVSKHCSIRIPTGNMLVFSCVKCAPMRGRMSKRAIVGIAVGSSIRTVSRMIMATVNVGRRGGGLKCAARRIGARTLSRPNAIGINGTLSNRMTNLAMGGPANVFRTPSFSLHKGAPLVIVSNIPIRSSLFSMSPRGVRDVGILGKATTTTLCNSQNGSNTVLVAAGLTGRSKLAIATKLSDVISTKFAIFPRARARFNSNSGNRCTF